MDSIRPKAAKTVARRERQIGPLSTVTGPEEIGPLSFPSLSCAKITEGRFTREPLGCTAGDHRSLLSVNVFAIDRSRQKDLFRRYLDSAGAKFLFTCESGRIQDHEGRRLQNILRALNSSHAASH